MARPAFVLSTCLVVLAAGAARGADPVEIDCKAQLAPWVGKSAADLATSWGKPTATSKWRRGGTKIVYDLTPMSPDSIEARKLKMPAAPSRGVPGSTAEATTTYEKSVQFDEKGGRTVKETPRGPAWVPKTYVFFTDAKGAIKKVDCTYGPPAGS